MASKRQFASFSEVVDYQYNLRCKFIKAEEEGDYQTVYDCFKEDKSIIIQSFKTTSVNDDVARVPPLSLYDPRVEINPRVLPEQIMDVKRLEILVKGIREQVGVLQAYHFKQTVQKHYQKRAKRETNLNKSRIAGLKEERNGRISLEKRRFIG